MTGSKTIQVALLRGINVGGNKKVAMADLRKLALGMGFTDAQTLLQSGNLVLRGGGKATGAALEALLDAEAKKRLGLEIAFIVRAAGEWKQVVAQNPFPAEARHDPAHLLVMFLRTPPATAAVDDLRAAITGREVLRARGKEVYLVYPDGIGTSRLTGAIIEKKLGTRATGRNWNTVLKLAALLIEP
jgi:uncharacterized protein (DUF1697 family)